MKNLWKNKDIISTCIKIEIFSRKVIFQMNSMGQFERKTVVGVESAVHSDVVYDVALLLSGTCKKVSIKEIGKTIFVWDFHVGQKMYVLDYWCREHLEHKKLTVCLAEIICVSEKRQIIKVIIENGNKSHIKVSFVSGWATHKKSKHWIIYSTDLQGKMEKNKRNP